MLHAPDITCDLPNPVLGPEALPVLAEAFPLRPAVFAHNLADHPLLSLDMLALAAGRMNPAHVECRQSANANGAGFAMTAAESAGPAATIRAIDRAGCWVMLRFAEQLPEYAEILDRLLAEIAPVTGGHGPALRPRAFIFISSPGTLTPFHFDPEFNVLFQIAGTKRFATCPPRAPWLGEAEQARFHRNGDNLLPWDETLREGATVHQLAPGRALYVPYKAPHWVEAGNEPSVSLSLTWSCARTIELEQAWQLSGWACERGLPIAPPPPFPGSAPLRALARRALGRLGAG
jgi:hypothetical protein